MNEPRFVDRVAVDALHRRSLEEHGGQATFATNTVLNPP